MPQPHYALPTQGTRLTEATVGRIVHGLRGAVAAMHADATAAYVLEKHQASSVAVLETRADHLQRSVSSLASAVLEELEALGKRLGSVEASQRRVADAAERGSGSDRTLASRVEALDAQLFTLSSALEVLRDDSASASQSASSSLASLRTKAASADTILADGLSSTQGTLQALAQEVAELRERSERTEAAHERRLVELEEALADREADRDDARATAASAVVSVVALSGRFDQLLAAHVAAAVSTQRVLEDMSSSVAASAEAARNAEDLARNAEDIARSAEDIARSADARAAVATSEQHDALERAAAAISEAVGVVRPTVVTSEPPRDTVAAGLAHPPPPSVDNE